MSRVQFEPFFKFKQFAVAPEDIQWGEADSIDFQINRGGQVISSALSRRSIAITLKGLTKDQCQVFVNQAAANRESLLKGTAALEEFTFGSMKIEKCYLAKATASTPVKVKAGGSAPVELVETLELEYVSIYYD